MTRILPLLLVVAVVAAIGFVATTKGFPSTHRAVTSFFHDDVGLSWQATTRATNVVRKAFHVPAYAVVAMLLWWALPRGVRRVWVVLGIILLIGLGDEWIQSRHPGRTGRVWDVGIDLVGAALGLWLLSRWRRRPANAAEDAPADA